MRPGTVVRRNERGRAHARAVLGLQPGDDAPAWLGATGVVQERPDGLRVPGSVFVQWAGSPQAWITRMDFLEEVPDA